ARPLLRPVRPSFQTAALAGSAHRCPRFPARSQRSARPRPRAAAAGRGRGAGRTVRLFSPRTPRVSAARPSSSPARPGSRVALLCARRAGRVAAFAEGQLQLAHVFSVAGEDGVGSGFAEDVACILGKPAERLAFLAAALRHLTLQLLALGDEHADHVECARALSVAREAFDERRIDAPTIESLVDRARIVHRIEATFPPAFDY